MTRRLIASLLLMLSCARAEDVVLGLAHDLYWSGEGADRRAAFSPVAAFPRREALVGFWHAKHSGGLGVQLNNDSPAKAAWKDLSGYGHDITLTDFSWTEYSGWGADGALNMDGSAFSTSLQLAGLSNAVTVLVLAQLYDNTTDTAFLFSGDPFWTPENPGTFFMTCNEGYIGRVPALVSRQAVYGWFPPTPSSWYAQTGVISVDQGYAALWQNYSAATNQPIADTVISNGTFWVGHAGPYYYRMNGKIGLLAVWNTALTENEISAALDTAYAQLGIRFITVTFDATEAGYSDYASARYVAGAPFGSLPAAYPYDPFLQFGYWQDSGSNYVDTASAAPSTNLTLYASYGPQTSYTLTLDAQGGTGSPATLRLLYNQSYWIDNANTVPVPTQDGWTFQGWYTEPYGGGTQVTEWDYFYGWDGLTLYAYWTEN